MAEGVWSQTTQGCRLQWPPTARGATGQLRAMAATREDSLSRCSYGAWTRALLPARAQQ